MVQRETKNLIKCGTTLSCDPKTSVYGGMWLGYLQRAHDVLDGLGVGAECIFLTQFSLVEFHQRLSTLTMLHHQTNGVQPKQKKFLGCTQSPGSRKGYIFQSRN